MGEISYDDKMRLQTLYEQGLGAKAIIAKYPNKGWKLVTVKAICNRIDQTGSAVTRVVDGRLQPERQITLKELTC